MAVQQTSRVYSISLPLDLADKAESMAKSESRSVDDVVGEALSSFYERKLDAENFFRELREYAASRPVSYTEEDIPRLIQEVRQEEREERLKAS